jgi:competence protein ComEC
LLGGVLSVLLAPALPPAWMTALVGASPIAVVALGALLDVAAPHSKASKFFSYRTCIGLVVCGIAVGFLHAWFQARSYLDDRWPVEQTDDRVIASVVIDTIPTVAGDSRFFDAIASIEKPEGITHALRIRVTSRAPEVTPHVGETWHLLLKLRPPRGRVNPGAPDTERVLFRERIHALGGVISSTINHKIDEGHRPVDHLRERIATHIDTRVADRDASALIQALAVGVTGSMSREQWRVFKATGTTHLVAISGLHVTLFAVVAFAVARAFWSAVLYRFVPWRRDNFAAAIGFTAATAYATLAGLSVPTQRTLIMLAAWLFTRAVARASPPFHSFALALLLVLILDPFAPLSGGFWLSFVAMAAIILMTSTRFIPRPALLEALTTQASVTVALAPLTLAAFGSVSLVGPFVNLVVIPAMSWVLVPTILFSIVLAPVSSIASDAVLHVAAWMHEQGWPWLAAAGDLTWALIHASPPLWWYAIALPSMFLALMPWPRTLRLALIVWVAPLAAAVEPPPDEGGVDITTLDVGAGTSVIIQTAQHVLVYDTGEVYGTGGRTAESVLIPVLRSRGVRRLDALVLSRLNGVSALGVTALLAEYAVDETFVSDPPPGLPNARDCAADHVWQWDGVGFQTTSGNICVLTLEAAGVRWVVGGGRRLPGDSGSVRVRIRPDGTINGPITARAASRALWRSSP